MWWSYLVVGLIGAIWLCVYWLVIQGTFAFIASTRNGPDQSTLSSTSLKHDDAAPSSMASQQKETQAQPLSEQRAKKPIPQTTGGGPAIPKRPQVSIEQHSEGPASPNTAIVGDNNQVTVNPPSNPLAPVIYYEFNGAKHTQTGNKFVAEAGEPFAKFQEMLDLEKNGKWVELQKEAESQIQSVPIWLTPYLFLAEARAHQGDTAKAIELCNFIKKRSGGNEQFDRPANNLLAQLAPKP